MRTFNFYIKIDFINNIILYFVKMNPSQTLYNGVWIGSVAIIITYNVYKLLIGRKERKERKEIIDNKANIVEKPNNVDEKDSTQLLYELCRDWFHSRFNYDVLKMYLENGANLNYTCTYREPYFMYDYVGETTFSIIYNRLNEHDRYKRLNEPDRNDKYKILKLCLKYGADVNLKYIDTYGSVKRNISIFTKICYAPEYFDKNRYKIIKLCLKHGGHLYYPYAVTDHSANFNYIRRNIYRGNGDMRLYHKLLKFIAKNKLFKSEEIKMLRLCKGITKKEYVKYFMPIEIVN